MTTGVTQAREQPWLRRKAPLWPTTSGCSLPPPENAALLHPPPFSNVFWGSLHHRKRVSKPHQMSSSTASAPVVPSHWTTHFHQMPLITRATSAQATAEMPGSYPSGRRLPGSPSVALDLIHSSLSSSPQGPPSTLAERRPGLFVSPHSAPRPASNWTWINTSGDLSHRLGVGTLPQGTCGTNPGQPRSSQPLEGLNLMG